MTTSSLEDESHPPEVTPEVRRERVETLHRLVKLFEGHDAEGEIRRLKEEKEAS